MVTLAQFEPRLKALTLQIMGNIDEGVRKVALAIDQAVVMATPVDTGAARSNWLVSMGSSRTDTISPYDPGLAGSTASANVSQALEQGRLVIEGYTSGKVIYISNNLPYIQRLNDGWSKQAQAGYILKAVQAATAALGNVRVVP